MSRPDIIFVAVVILALVLLGVWLLAPSVLIEACGLMDGKRLEAPVARAGLWGPVVSVTLMTVTVVASPIPGAPIALAAGAACLHPRGTRQVVTGAGIGALIR
ncbi:hypothetical protein [Paracoccus salsus]|uniref:hypothetical protein n=1 Tax=Paracoccus salsus TaxID=2911061 RepID=UPI001F38179B|nr:hypothetical protein [Paracoccus salsus]MCF3972327.1 hypothetical protein [Paracoccus salsus]